MKSARLLLEPGLPDLVCALLLMGAAGPLAASAADSADAPERSPFTVLVTQTQAVAGPLVRVDFGVTPGCILYSERLRFLTSAGDPVAAVELPEPVLELDPITRQQKKVYERSFAAFLKPEAIPDHRLTIKFQGCTNGACFAPEEKIFALGPDGRFAEAPEDGSGGAAGQVSALDWSGELKDFKVLGRQTGFLKSSDFMAFLQRAVSGNGAEDDPLAHFRSLGLAATLVLILAGGFLLNFTPCVLPMVPINLAIIGAGAQARSKADGFRAGGTYGLGMALAYGALGLVVVLTGAKFGALNSSYWFNGIIALIFVVMALGMFDVVNIDMSRFGSAFRGPAQPGGKGSLAKMALVFCMGVMAALLAGACVAPVVVSVMLLSTNLYAKGLAAGLLLPFLLGLGMALPWPLAGAGLAFLPKPGKWMKTVKYGFGCVIVLFALYYGHTAWHVYALERPARSTLAAAPAGATPASAAEEANRQFLAALRRARAEGRPVFVDFHASWCKNCLAMDQAVFNQRAVQKRLQDFIVVRYDAEQPNQPPAKEVLDHFGVMGLPSYLVVTAGK